MNLRIVQYWDDIRSSYWFVPSVMMIGAALLFVASIEADRRFRGELIERFGWIFSGGPEGARQVLSTVAGSMITVAGVTFSITIVALSLASAQLGPRILSSFMRDTGNQVVLGTFISTFLYCVLVLRTVRGEGEDMSSFVPYASVTLGVALSVISLGVLVFFIHHVSVSIQAPHVVAEVAHDLHDAIDRIFPHEAGHGADEEPAAQPGREMPEHFDDESLSVATGENGYIQAVDLDRLMELAREHDLLLRIDRRPGHFVARGRPLLRIWPAGRVREETGDALRQAFVLGARRTATQDVEFPVNQLVEIALRALSPSVNDPFTAINCIDRLGAALCHLLARRIPSGYRFDEDHRLRIVTHHAVSFSGVADAAFHQIRQNASYHVSIRIRLLETIEVLIGCASDEADRAVLLRHADLIRRETDDNVPNPADRVDIDQRYQAVLRALASEQTS